MVKVQTEVARGESDDAIRASIHHSPVPTVISDPLLPDNPIIEVNDAFLELTGYHRDEIIGRNCRFLAGPKTEQWVSEKIRDGIRELRAVLVEILNYKKDGSPFRNAVLIAPVFDDDAKLRFFIGSQIELIEADTGPATKRHQVAVEKMKMMSPRQLQILRDMAAGFRSKQIAYRLQLSERTVKMHRSILLKKLDASNMADAVRIAVEAGL
jgi:PAS domain S-box-containing protein